MTWIAPQWFAEFCRLLEAWGTFVRRPVVDDELIAANALEPGQALLVAIWIAFLGHMVLGAIASN